MSSYEYLNDKSCKKIQSIMRRNFFNRLELASPKYYDAKVEKSPEVLLPPIKKAKRKSKLTLQLAFSDKIRKENFERGKKYKLTHPQTETSKSYREMTARAYEDDYRKEMEDNLSKGIRKAKLPKIERRQLVDFHAMKYDTRYIDKVEEKFIKPFLSRDNMIYCDYIENKKSRIPLNFMIS